MANFWSEVAWEKRGVRAGLIMGGGACFKTFFFASTAESHKYKCQHSQFLKCFLWHNRYVPTPENFNSF